MTPQDTYCIRPTTFTDLGEVDALLSRAYPALLKADYAPSVLVTALPLISRAQPNLLRSGTYFAAICRGRIAGAGGWTWAAPTGGSALAKATGHIRHVVTDPKMTRRGVGRCLMAQVLASARRAGAQRMECLSTLTAAPFYSAVGFTRIGAVDVTLGPGIRFPVVHMEMRIGV